MILSQTAKQMPSPGENLEEGPVPPELLALKRNIHFRALLRNELDLCRTETEREVVLSALYTTQIEIRRLKRKVNRLWRIEAM